MNRDLFRVVSICSSITWGAIVASLQALTPVADGFTFQLSWLTIAAFIGATAIVYFCWQVLFKHRHGANEKIWRIALEILMVLSGVAAFLYPLRFVPKAKLPEICIGLASATVALSIVGILLLRIGRFLQEDSRQNDSQQQ
jgi:cation transport ATPase